MKKLGLLCLVLMVALGAAGAGYAIWTSTVDIEASVDTGTVEIGIRDTGTSDPGTTLDPRRELGIDGAPVAADKHVAKTTSTNGAFRCDHGADFYDSITYRYENIYPGYAPTVYHQICNCGTIPVHLTFSCQYAGDPEVLMNMDIVEWVVIDNGVEMGRGHDADGLNSLLDGYQLHPCHRLSIQEEVHWYTNDLPQGTSLEWTITVIGTQWNAAAP